MFEKFRNTIQFWKYNTHPAKMEHRSRTAVLFGSERALELFNNAEFRRLIKFEKHSEEEQNRFFNELTVTNIVLLMLLLDQRVQETSDAYHKEYLQTFRLTVPEFYKGFLRRIGIKEEFAVTWDKLVELRYDEYSNDTLEMRRRFFDEPNTVMNEMATNNRLMVFQTVVLGLYSHLMRGKIKKDDPFYKHLQYYLVTVYKGFLKKV